MPDTRSIEVPIGGHFEVHFRAVKRAVKRSVIKNTQSVALQVALIRGFLRKNSVQPTHAFLGSA